MPRCEEIAEQVRPLPDACSRPPADVFLSLGQVGLSAPLAVQTIKKVAMAGLDVTMEEGLVMESDGQDFLMTTDDSREGTNAFAEKRPPNWKGR